ncbi:MAG TPA: arylesterase [Bryobacteraceae bacterium]|jgi:acyl-CoA thioesterase-1|nr:arylesterase [Bryobacteraceae bacterium]
MTSVIIIAVPARLTICLAIALTACGRHQNSEAPAHQPAASPAATKAPDTRKIIVAFGDSISAGFGVEPGKSFPDDLQRLIDQAGYKYQVVNLGVSGDTTTDGVERLPVVLALHPAIVVVEFGGNDGLRGLPVTASKANLATIIQAILKSGAKVVLAGMTLPRNYGPEYIHPFEQMYVDLAKEYKVTLIPFVLEGVGGNAALTQPDGIHPTAEGAAIVAQTVMRYTKPLL